MSSTESAHSYMDLYTELYELVGSKIQFKTTGGDEFEGIIKYVLPKRKHVSFEHVYHMPTHEYAGNLIFLFSDFLSYSVLKSEDKYPKFEYLRKILDKKIIGNKYHITDVLNQDFEEESIMDETMPDPDELFKDNYVMNLPDNLRSKLPHDSIVLESIDVEFFQAIDYISQQRVIGVSFEGPKISRLGKLTWICISTPYCVFLFDIGLLGKDAFDKGLRNIFQAKSIEKVIHDCRQPSDCLSHLFSTELINVFDTQVADYIVNMQRYRDKPTFKHVSSLDSCLVHHLDVPQEFLFNRNKRLSYDDEVFFFRVRPISHDYRDAVIKNAVYLVLLKETLAELMLNPFRKAVDIYLKVLANASEPELLLDISVPEMIPPAIVMEGIQTVRFQEIPSESAAPLVCRFRVPEKTPVTDDHNKPSNVSVKDKSISPQEKVAAVPLTCRFRGGMRDVADDYNRPSNIVAKNTSVERGDGKNVVVGENNLHNIITKKDEVLHQTIVTKRNLCNKNVTTEQISMQNSRIHIDNVYHRLANSCHNFSNAIDVKPSQDYVSNFTVKKLSVCSSVSIKNTSESDSHSDSSESNISNSSETVSECSVENSTDSSDTWAKLRSDFGLSSYGPQIERPGGSRKRLHFVPAGML